MLIRYVQKITLKMTFFRLTIFDEYRLKIPKEYDMHIPSLSHLFHRNSSAKENLRDERNSLGVSTKTSVSSASAAVRTSESSEAADSSMARSEIYPESLNISTSRNPALEMCLKKVEGSVQERFIRHQIAKYEALRESLVSESSEVENGKAPTNK